jgi:hypothetical protein
MYAGVLVGAPLGFGAEHAARGLYRPQLDSALEGSPRGITVFRTQAGWNLEYLLQRSSMCNALLSLRFVANFAIHPPLPPSLPFDSF